MFMTWAQAHTLIDSLNTVLEWFANDPTLDTVELTFETDTDGMVHFHAEPHHHRKR
jgi:hypothetical protein